MDKTHSDNVSKIDDEIKRFMKENSDILYEKEANKIGSRIDEKTEINRKTLDGKFTKHLAASGMYKFSGLNTTTDKERFMNGSKDWMLKIV